MYSPTMQGPQPAFRHQEAKSIHPRQQCIGRRAMVLQRFWTRRVWRVSAGDFSGFSLDPRSSTIANNKITNLAIAQVTWLPSGNLTVCELEHGHRNSGFSQ